MITALRVPSSRPIEARTRRPPPPAAQLATQRSTNDRINAISHTLTVCSDATAARGLLIFSFLVVFSAPLPHRFCPRLCFRHDRRGRVRPDSRSPRRFPFPVPDRTTSLRPRSACVVRSRAAAAVIGGRQLTSATATATATASSQAAFDDDATSSFARSRVFSITFHRPPCRCPAGGPSE